MDRKEIFISNATCTEQVQILTLFVSSNLAYAMVHVVQLFKIIIITFQVLSTQIRDILE